MIATVHIFVAREFLPRLNPNHTHEVSARQG
jgi:hypothetical protein